MYQIFTNQDCCSMSKVASNSGSSGALSDNQPGQHLIHSSALFTGRDTYLEKLKKHFHPDKGLPGRKSYLLHGLGGIGKTQISFRFIEQNEDW